MTLAFTTEILGKSKDGDYGYKAAVGIPLQTLRQYSESGIVRNVLPGSLSQTFHITQNRITGYAQLNTGFYAFNFRVGMNYQLSR